MCPTLSPLPITAFDGPPAFRGLPPSNLDAWLLNVDAVVAGAVRSRVQAAMAALRAAAPGTGTYLNECDYFQTDGQKAFWGPNYARLSDIKRRYDPDGLFTVHHGVDSESWSADGFTKLP
jgi:FAD/FMN-containing dehydrogenase